MKQPAEVEGLLGAAEGLGVELSSRQAETILRFEHLLIERAAAVGGLSDRDLADPVRVRSRHVLDCLRAASLVRGEDADAYDLGAGAGLPGVVVAAARPGLLVRLVESRRRKAAFLELAVQQLSLPNVEVLPRRIQELRRPVDLCFARALAPLEASWALAEPLLRAGGRLVYFAGFEVARETPQRPLHTLVVPPPPGLLESAGPLVIMARE